MPKSGIAGSARRRLGRSQPTAVPEAVEGQIAEICRDLAVQTKRMRQLQEQAVELRTAIRQWASESDGDSGRQTG